MAETGKTFSVGVQRHAPRACLFVAANYCKNYSKNLQVAEKQLFNSFSNLSFQQLKSVWKCFHFLLMLALFTFIWQDFAKNLRHDLKVKAK